MKFLFIIPILLVLSNGGMAQPGSGETVKSATAIVGNTRMHYLHYQPHDTVPIVGSVLLVHGYVCSSFSWRNITDSLIASGFEVVAIDIPPYGLSDVKPVINQSFSALAFSLWEFLDSLLPGRKFHLAGHSLGAGVVQAMAIMYPEQMSTVTFVDGVIFRSVKEGFYHVPHILRTPLSRGFVLAFLKPALMNKPMVTYLLRSVYGRPPESYEISGYLSPLRGRGKARSILKSMAESYEIATLTADSLKVPVLAIWGSLDQWIPEKLYGPVLEQMPDTRKVIIPGAAHIPMETHPEEFLRYFLPFLIVNTPSEP